MTWRARARFSFASAVSGCWISPRCTSADEPSERTKVPKSTWAGVRGVGHALRPDAH